MVEIKFRHFFFISNLLSFLRFLLLIPLYLFLAQTGHVANLLLLGVIAAAIVSDFLDGYCARRLDQKSDLGRILDPLADKIIIVIGLLGFVIYRGFPLTLVLLLGYRDLMILLGGLLLLKKSGQITESNIWGKANTVIVSATGFFFIVAPLWWGTQGLLMISYISVIGSGLCYLFVAMRMLQVTPYWRVIILALFIVPMIAIFYFLPENIINIFSVLTQ